MFKIMNHYSYTENQYHKCEAPGCCSRSFYQVYPSLQPSGIMHGSVMLCKKHFKIFEKRYWQSVDDYFNEVMNGKISNIVKIITH